MTLITQFLPVMLALIGLVLVMAGLLGQGEAAGRRIVPGILVLTVAPLLGHLGPSNMISLAGLVGLIIGFLRAVSKQNQLLDVVLPVVAGICLMLVGEGEEFIWPIAEI